MSDIWFAVWCMQDGSIVANAFSTHETAFMFYEKNPHDVNLSLCQWRGVYDKHTFAENVLKIT